MTTRSVRPSRQMPPHAMTDPPPYRSYSTMLMSAYRSHVHRPGSIPSSHVGHKYRHGIWAAFSIETFANVLQNFLSLVHYCCGTFANCFDTEHSPGLVCEENGTPVTQLPMLMILGKVKSSSTVFPVRIRPRAGRLL